MNGGPFTHPEGTHRHLSIQVSRRCWEGCLGARPFGLLQFFDHVQGTDGFAYKPAPDVLLRAIAALDAKPEDCLFVGDSETDMEAGRRAGIRVCAVRYGYGDPAALAKWQPDFWIDNLGELATW